MNNTPLSSGPSVAEISDWVETDKQAPETPCDPSEIVVKRGDFSGLEWTFRDVAEPLLRHVQPQAWHNPERQGWVRIKQNAVRSVWRAEIGGRHYYLKYYTHDDWRDRFKRLARGPACEIEFQNALFALKTGIPAIQPLACCSQLRESGCARSLLVTQAVQPAYPLNEYWELIGSDENLDRSRRDRYALIDLLAEMIARAHQAGFEHRDIHAANILVHPLGRRRYRTFFVDLQSVRVGRPLSDRLVVRNLGMLNQWFRRHAGICDRLRFLRRYLRWRNEYEAAFRQARPLTMAFDELVFALAENAERHAGRLWAKRDRRVCRSGKYFSKIRLGNGWSGHVFLQSKRVTLDSESSGLVLSREWWHAQLPRLLATVAETCDASCKESHSARVSRAELTTNHGRLAVIIKRPLARNQRRKFRMLFGTSRSRRGWKTGYALLNRDIPAARPLAMLERRLGPLVLDSVLITEQIGDSRDLEAHLRGSYAVLEPRAWSRHKRVLSSLLARRLRQLAERGFIHRDCKAQNVLVREQPRLNLIWIDMDGIRRVHHVSLKDELRALARLHVSLSEVPGVTRTDRIRFLKTYLARFGVDALAWRQVVRSLERISAKKLLSRHKRRRWKIRHYGRE